MCNNTLINIYLKKESISTECIVLINTNVTCLDILVSTTAMQHQKSVVENVLSSLVTSKVLIVQLTFQRMLFLENSFKSHETQNLSRVLFLYCQYLHLKSNDLKGRDSFLHIKADIFVGIVPK